jgi:FkbM family methyltransferase
MTIESRGPAMAFGMGYFRKIFPLNILHRKVNYAVRRKLLKQQFMIASVMGSRMVLPLKEAGIGRILTIFGERELDQYEILKRCIRSSDTILDIGSNIGYYPCIERKFLNKQGHVYCIEPDYRNVAYLRKNMERHLSESSFEVMDGAVSNEAGEIYFNLARETNLNSINLTRAGGSATMVERGFSDRQYVEKVKVRLYSFAELLCKLDRSIDFVRMDIEGHEAVLLLALASSLESGMSVRRAPRVILFEPHSWEYTEERSLSKALIALSKFGYTVKFLGSRSEPMSAISSLGYKPALTLAEKRGVVRGVFTDIPQDEAIRLASAVDGVTTVCLERPV